MKLIKSISCHSFCNIFSPGFVCGYCWLRLFSLKQIFISNLCTSLKLLNICNSPRNAAFSAVSFQHILIVNNKELSLYNICIIIINKIIIKWTYLTSVIIMEIKFSPISECCTDLKEILQISAALYRLASSYTRFN